MPECDICKEETGILPFKCNYCGGTFCKEHRLPENHGCNYDLEYRKKILEEKHHKVVFERRQRQKRLIYSRKNKGSSFLYLAIVICSIVAFYFPHYLCISYQTFNFYYQPYLWTLFSSIFVFSFSNSIEFINFIILLFFAYHFIKVIESSHGSKFLFLIFILFSISSGLLSFFLSFAFKLPISFYSYNIGLASVGLIGLITFTVISNPNQEWIFLKYGVKSGLVLGLLVLFSIIFKIISSIVENFYWLIIVDFYTVSYFVLRNFSWYILDVIGILVSLMYYYGYYIRIKLKARY